VGTLFELTAMAPFRCPLGTSPCLCLPQDWAIGLLYLKIGARLMLLPPVAAPLRDVLAEAQAGQGLGRAQRRRLVRAAGRMQAVKLAKLTLAGAARVETQTQEQESPSLRRVRKCPR
jgi:hypothetical protein